MLVRGLIAVVPCKHDYTNIWGTSCRNHPQEGGSVEVFPFTIVCLETQSHSPLVIASLKLVDMQRSVDRKRDHWLSLAIFQVTRRKNMASISMSKWSAHFFQRPSSSASNPSGEHTVRLEWWYIGACDAEHENVPSWETRWLVTRLPWEPS
jgi:hypothetical protein